MVRWELLSEIPLINRTKIHLSKVQYQGHTQISYHLLALETILQKQHQT